MVSYEASTVAKADPEHVWAAWIDVARWTEAERIQSAELDGEFRPGGTIVSKSKGLPRTKLTITRVEPPRVWVDEFRSPGVKMTYEHVLDPVQAGTTLTVRVQIRGPFARIVGPLLRRRLIALFADSGADVARRAEAVQHAAHQGRTKVPS